MTLAGASRVPQYCHNMPEFGQRHIDVVLNDEQGQKHQAADFPSLVETSFLQGQSAVPIAYVPSRFLYKMSDKLFGTCDEQTNR